MCGFQGVKQARSVQMAVLEQVVGGSHRPRGRMAGHFREEDLGIPQIVRRGWLKTA